MWTDNRDTSGVEVSIWNDSVSENQKHHFYISRGNATGNSASGSSGKTSLIVATTTENVNVNRDLVLLTQFD